MRFGKGHVTYRVRALVLVYHAKEKGLKIQQLSVTEFRKRLRSGGEIPEWFAFRSVVDVLRAA